MHFQFRTPCFFELGLIWFNGQRLMIFHMMSPRTCHNCFKQNHCFGSYTEEYLFESYFASNYFILKHTLKWHAVSTSWTLFLLCHTEHWATSTGCHLYTFFYVRLKEKVLTFKCSLLPLKIILKMLVTITFKSHAKASFVARKVTVITGVLKRWFQRE